MLRHYLLLVVVYILIVCARLCVCVLFTLFTVDECCGILSHKEGAKQFAKCDRCYPGVRGEEVQRLLSFMSVPCTVNCFSYRNAISLGIPVARKLLLLYFVVFVPFSQALVYATWRGDPPMPSPRAAGNSPANEVSLCIQYV